MIDPTKTSPEKLAEMNDSLIVDNNYLRAELKKARQELAQIKGHLAYFDGIQVSGGDCRGTLRNTESGARSIFDDVDQ